MKTDLNVVSIDSCQGTVCFSQIVYWLVFGSLFVGMFDPTLHFDPHLMQEMRNDRIRQNKLTFFGAKASDPGLSMRIWLGEKVCVLWWIMEACMRQTHIFVLFSVFLWWCPRGVFSYPNFKCHLPSADKH